MKAEIYSLKDKKKVSAEIVGKKKTANGKCQIIGKNSKGDSLYLFVSQKDYDGKYASVKVVK